MNEVEIQKILKAAQLELMLPENRDKELEDILEEMGEFDAVIDYMMEGGDIMQYRLR